MRIFKGDRGNSLVGIVLIVGVAVMVIAGVIPALVNPYSTMPVNKLLSALGTHGYTAYASPAGDFYVNNLLPNADSTYDVGASGNEFAKGYFDALDVGDLDVNNIEYFGTYWDDVRTPVTSVRVPGAKAPSWTAFRGSQVLAFADQAVLGNEEEVFFVIQIPHSYKEGTDLVVHIHFMFSTDTIGDKVRWGLSYSWANIDEAFPAATVIYALSDASDNDDGFHRVVNFPSISGTGKTISGILTCKLFRNSSHVDDTYAADAYFLEIDAHYNVDTPGSKEEYTK